MFLLIDTEIFLEFLELFRVFNFYLDFEYLKIFNM